MIHCIVCHSFPWTLELTIFFPLAPLTTHDAKAAGKRTYGFKMVIKGAISGSLGALVMYVITIIIQETTTNIIAP
jgi:hypothetical protein